MQTYTTADGVAINGTNRTMQYLATISTLTGGPLTVSAFATDREVKDLPDQIDAFTGVASGQATVTVTNLASVAALSPYKGAGPSSPIGSRITLGVQFAIPGGWGTVFTVFTGYVTALTFSATGTATITVNDSASLMSGSLNLPSASSLQPSGSGAAAPMGDVNFSPLAVIDQALRSGGIYLTPPPNVAAVNRAAVTNFSVSGFGGYLPDVGLLTIGPGIGVRIAGQWTPDIVQAQNPYPLGVKCRQLQTFAPIARTLQYLWVDGWINAISTQIMSFDAFYLIADTTGITVEENITGGGNFLNVGPAVSIASDGLWHYFSALITVTGPKSIVITATLDATTATSSTLSGYLPVYSNCTTGVITISSAMEAFEIIAIPFGSTVPVPTSRYGTPAGHGNAIIPTPVRLPSIVGQVGVGSWATVQAVAEAEGAVAGFDELDRLAFTPHATWQALRTGSPVATASGADRLKDLTVNESNLALFRSVSLNYHTVTAARDSTASPAYSAGTAGTLLTFPARSTTTQAIVPANPIFGIPTVFQSNVDPGGGTATESNYYVAVDSSRVSDPAAPVITNLTVSAVPSSAGFNLTVVNPNPYSISFWSPVLAANYLVVHGTVITSNPPVALTAAASSHSSQDLALADNIWRQDPVASQLLVNAVAADVSSIIPTFDDVTIPGDPRLQLGDLYSVFASTIMATPVAALIVGVLHDAQPGAAFVTRLKLRAIGAATGWLLGVAGRTELATTTVLPS